LHPARWTGRLFDVPEGRVIEREEVTPTLFVIADLNVHTARIKTLLEEYLEVPEDDA